MDKPNALTNQGNIFISYRRLDTAGYAGRLYDFLCNHFEKDRIFIDIDTIELGDDFIDVIENALASCKIFIAIIGKRWNGSEEGKHLLDNSNDFVRIELANALARKIKIIPVLVEKVKLPIEEELPEILRPILRKQALELENVNWKNGVNRLLQVIKEELSDKKARKSTTSEPLVLVDPTEDDSYTNPSNFIAESGLHDVVNTALSLKKPLLLGGEPGVGKTLVAYKIASDFNSQPIVFNCKSYSKSQDVFYSFNKQNEFNNTTSRFINEYIQLGAIGLGILLTLDNEQTNNVLPEYWRGMGPKQSVILFDGVDKLEREVALDIIEEIDRMELFIKEINQKFTANPKLKPIIIFTTNQEKNLPDTFLSRCVFYQIPFPDVNHLIAIAKSKLKKCNEIDDRNLYELTRYFLNIREINTGNKPSIPEFLDWLIYLIKNHTADIDFKNLSIEQSRILKASFSIVTKNSEDFRRLNQSLGIC